MITTNEPNIERVDVHVAVVDNALDSFSENPMVMNTIQK